MKQLWSLFLTACCGATAAGAAVPIVSEGQPRALVVLPAVASEVELYAAQELVDHVAQATGVTLAIVAEGQLPAAPTGRVWIGATGAAAAAGIDVGALPPDTFRLLTRGNELFIAGHDSEGPATGYTTLAGTLYGVYEILEKQLGVRWLWPGELGVEVPKTASFQMPETDLTIEPWLVQRSVRTGLFTRGDMSRGFTAEGYQNYKQAQEVYLRRHRMGQSLPLKYGHAYTDWWAKYGAEHPEWFQLVDGKRGPTRPGAWFSMCVSDPGFIEQVVEVWRQKRLENPGQFVNLNGCENDIAGLCECENCQAWDGPQPADLPARFKNPKMVSDRYARFWLTAQQLAAREDPDAKILGYAYVNYAAPPTTDIKLNENIWVGTVPDVWFPRDPASQQWVKDQWDGWSQTGCRLFLRPNYFLDGYCMPQIFDEQFADEFKHEAERGMIATDFDSLTGQWSTQGTNLYTLMRLQTRPEMSVGDILSEYYAAFGPAAPKVRAYFDYWRDYTYDKVHPEKPAMMWSYSGYASHAPRWFSDEAFEAAGMILDEALTLAKEPKHRARVEWLQKGWRHARLARNVAAGIVGMVGQRASFLPAEVHRLHQELIDYRHETEGDFIANFHFLAYLEDRGWKMPSGYAGQPLRAGSATVAPLAGDPVVSVRGTVTFVALLAQGETFQANVATRRVGQNELPVDWALFSEAGARVAEGSIPAGETVQIRQPVTAAGVYTLMLSSGGQRAGVTLLNDHAALASENFGLIYAGAPLYFQVPTGTRGFTLKLGTTAPGETATFSIKDSTGREVYTGSTGEVAELLAKIEVPAGQDGQVWQLSYGPAATGILEDVTIAIVDGLPGYWSQAADRILLEQ